VSHIVTLRAMFLLYGVIGLVVWWLYRQPVVSKAVNEPPPTAAALGPSRRIVVRLAALFSVDAFAGGLVVNSLMALWLLQRFGLSLGQAGAFFFWAGLLSAASQLAAPLVARRIGLLNTMVFTHIPANICLVLAALAPNLYVALALLFVRSALSQMDVPTRTAYVMAVVTPAERPAAASFTAMPRSLAAALSPTISGALLAAGFVSLPLVACGVLKIAYDLALWRGMRGEHLPGEEVCVTPACWSERLWSKCSTGNLLRAYLRRACRYPPVDGKHGTHQSQRPPHLPVGARRRRHRGSAPVSARSSTTTGSQPRPRPGSPTTI